MQSENRIPGRPSKARLIVPAAKALFIERGYEAVSMDDVALAAGVSKATLYAHYASKEELFFATIVGAISEASSKIVIPEVFPGDARAILETFARSLLDMIMQADGFSPGKLSFDMRHHPRLAQIASANGPELTIRRLAVLLGQIDASGELSVPDPETSARHLHTLAIGDYPHRLGGGLPAPTAEEVEAHVASGIDLFIRAHAPRGGARL
jgi:AcrR family transcriptional regulator